MSAMTRYGLVVAVLATGISAGCQTERIMSRHQGGLPFSDSVQRFQDPGSTPSDPAALSGDRLGASSPDAELPMAASNPAQVVKQVVIRGNELIPEHHLASNIRTRPGRYFDPDLLQQDVSRLWKMKGVRRVNGPFLDYQPDGIVVTFEIHERPYMASVKYVGNRAVTDRQLATESGLKDGDPLDLHAVKMAKTRIEDYYHEKGFPDTQVTIVSGDDPSDREVIFLINEDELQRVSSVDFEGNTVAPDGRLRSMIKMKPGILWYFGGKFNRRELEQDELRLTAYYRALGYFNARVGRELVESDDGRWLSIRYIINEGPRYKIRSVSFVGNEKYTTDELETVVKLKPLDGEMPEFNAARMNEDVTRIQDLYGSQGHVFANVEASPDFLEEPGYLDLVYRIEEGEQYRVGDINILIDGEYGITKRQVVLNRLGLRPGDVIDTRKIDAAKGRLIRSQLFSDGMSSPGREPQIVVKPPELDEIGQSKFR